MAFESMNAVAAAIDNVNVTGDGFAVKVSYGGEIRRAAAVGTTYAAVRYLCARLFELDPATVLLKYQDDDGDKITMSSDGELQEAIRAAKEKNVLRLFVEIKGPAFQPPTEEERPAFPCGRGGRGGWGPFGGRGGFRGWGPRGGHHGFHGGFPPHPHPFAGSPNFPADPTGQAPTDAAPGAPDPNSFSGCPFRGGPFRGGRGGHFRGGLYYPPHHGGSPYARAGFKEHKHAMKDQIRMMKANAVTEEDRQAIKELKEHMKAAKQALKEEWRAEKLQWKEYKKCDKKDRKEWKCDKKDRKDRKDRKDKKCDKTDRLVAKHVADLTIPDNSELSADSPVTKTWRLRNAGLIAWPVDSHLIFISRRGDNLNGPERVFVGAVEPQQEVDVSVTFITPPEAGRYIGYYRMATGDGAKFGQRVWVSFIIPATAPRGEAAPNVPVLYPVVAHTASTTALLAHDVTMH